MNLLQLEYFVTVAKCEHMTQAANLLHISQPTLSQVIKNLELELGVPLFERQGRHIRLGIHGKYLLERADFILAYIEETKNGLAQANAYNTPPEIPLCMHTGHLTFQKIIQNFHKHHNYVNFKILQSDTLLPDALNICSDAMPGNAMNRCYLFDDEIYLIVSKKSRFAYRKSIDVSELKDEDFINNETQFLKEITQPYCERAGFVPKFTYTVQKNSEVRTLLEMGYGIAFWPRVAFEEILSDELLPIKLSRPICIRSMFITYPQNRPLTHIEQCFISYCRDYFAQN